MRLLRIAAITLLCVLAETAFAQTATGINYTSTTPAAPTGTINVKWQHDSSYPNVNASAYVTYPTVQVACPTSGDLSVPVSTAMAVLPTGKGGIIDARGCQAATTWTNAISFTNPGTTLLLPCATLTASQTLTVPAGIRNTAIHGCAYQGGSTASGTTGATVWVYTGSGNAFTIGDPTYAADTPGFLIDNLNINTASAGSAAQAFHFYRAQELRLDNLYLNGNGSTGQTGVTLDGTGNYSGGVFTNIHMAQFNTGVLLTGHLSGSGVDDYANASTFVKIHIDCPTSGGLPIAGSYGFNIQGGDGNTVTGGDVEGCANMTHLGANATGNTFTGLRSENSTMQYVADAGSSYNSVTMGGTLFTGQISDAGSRNSFNDAFHRTANGLNGDWYASQVDATVTDHQRLGIGNGNERGRETEIQTDWGYRWMYGFTDATAGEQWYGIQDIPNNVWRLNIGQGNPGGSTFNQQTQLNSAGTGAVLLNSGANAGTGGVVIGSGGSTPTTVASYDSSGNHTINGYQRFWASGAEAWRLNCASTSACNIDSWATGSPIHHLRMYNGSGTEIDSEGTAAVTINNTSTAGTGGLIVYGGGASYYNTSMFKVTPNGSGGAVYQFPTLAATSGHYCAQLDNSGYLSNTGAPCTGAPGNQTAATFYAGPATGSAAAPTFRAIAATDVPTLNQNTTGNATTASASNHSPTQCPAGQYSTGDTTAWAANCAQISYNQISGTPPFPIFTGFASTTNGTPALGNFFVPLGKYNYGGPVTITIRDYGCALGMSSTFYIPFAYDAGYPLSIQQIYNFGSAATSYTNPSPHYSFLYEGAGSAMGDNYNFYLAVIDTAAGCDGQAKSLTFYVSGPGLTSISTTDTTQANYNTNFQMSTYLNNAGLTGSKLPVCVTNGIITTGTNTAGVLACP